MPDVLIRERRGGVEHLVLNRPDKRNALDLALVGALHAALDDLTRDRALRVVILRSSSEHFMAGADIAQLRERGAADALDAINGSLFQRIEDLPVPVLAAVGGYARGGGCELALAADLRVAGASARFGQPEAALGIIPGAGATYRLPRLVGMGVAREMIFTGRTLDAEEALRVGLVNRVVADEALLAETEAMAGSIVAQAPDAVRLAKLALNAQRAGGDYGQALERLAQAVLYESPEKRSRMTAFLERKASRKAGPSRDRG
jgi:enoyl-CoA hydratase